MSKLKCLFGYHKYDEAWGTTRKQGHAILKVCTICRKVAHYRFGILDTYPWVMEILFENKYYFTVRAPSKVIYRFDKQESQTLTLAMRVLE